MSQSSASRIVGELERDLGVSLLSRTTRAVMLTEAGADYLLRVEALLDGLNEADHLVRGGEGLAGTLRLGLSMSLALREIVPRLPAFLARHPALNLDLAIADHHQDLVAEGIDIALRLGPMPDSGNVARKLGTAPRVVVAAPAYLASRAPIATPRDLSAHWIIVGPGAARPPLHFRRGAESVSIRPEGRVKCGVNEGATAAACAGLGITVASMWSVAREIRAGALVRLLADWSLPEVPLHAVFPPARLPRPAARLFADFIATALADDGPAIGKE